MNTKNVTSKKSTQIVCFDNYFVSNERSESRKNIFYIKKVSFPALKNKLISEDKTKNNTQFLKFQNLEFSHLYTANILNFFLFLFILIHVFI